MQHRLDALRWSALAALLAQSAALRECWEGHSFTYIWCCSNPPGTPHYNTMCWNDDVSGDGLTRYFYDRCCDIRFGPRIRALPAFWTRTVELEFASGARIALEQAPVQTANRNFSWDPNGVVTGDVRRWAPLYGVIWEDRAARVMLDTRLLAFLRELHGGRPLRVLDIASGLGLNTIAAGQSGLVELAVGIDADARGVQRAKANARRNGAGKAHLLHFDACSPPQALERLMDEQVPGASGEHVRFDLFTMSGFHAPALVIEHCVHELMLALAGPMAAYLESDGHYFGSAYKYGSYPGFSEFAGKRGIPVLHKGRIDLGQLHGTDEAPFLPIMPVDVWMFIGRDYMDVPLPPGFSAP